MHPDEGRFVQKPQPVQAWFVPDLFQYVVNRKTGNLPEAFLEHYENGHVDFDHEGFELLVKGGKLANATKDHWIVFREDEFEIFTKEEFDELFEPPKQIVGSWSGYGWIGSEEIKHRFGFHKAAIEGENAKNEDHAKIRKMFVEFAGQLDQIFGYRSREKEIAFDHLEDASMWFHKTLGRQGELVDEFDG